MTYKLNSNTKFFKSYLRRGTVLGVLMLSLLTLILLGSPKVVTVSDDASGTLLPATGVWNGFNNHQVVLECFNGSNTDLSLNLKVKGANNIELGVESLIIPKHSSKHAWFNKYPITNSYGTFEISDSKGGNPKVSCFTVSYRMEGDNSVEYATTMPLVLPTKGKSAGVYNSINPEASSSSPIYNWLSIYNPSSEIFNASVNVRDRDGQINQSKTISISNLTPGERRDFALGHPDGQTVGIYEIIPSNPNASYGAFLSRYSQVGQDEFNFSMTLHSSSGYYDSGLIPASTMGPANNWGEVANISNKKASIALEIFDRNGKLLSKEDKEILPYSQYHIFLNPLIGELNVGFFRVQSNVKILAQSFYYGQDHAKLGSVGWAYNAAGAGDQYSKKASFPINTHLNAPNWIKIFNKDTSKSATLDLNIFDSAGNQISLGSQSQISFTGTKDLAIHEIVGPEFVGSASLSITNQDDAFQAQLIRVYVGGSKRSSKAMDARSMKDISNRKRPSASGIEYISVFNVISELDSSYVVDPFSRSALIANYSETPYVSFKFDNVKGKSLNPEVTYSIERTSTLDKAGYPTSITAEVAALALHFRCEGVKCANVSKDSISLISSLDPSVNLAEEFSQSLNFYPVESEFKPFDLEKEIENKFAGEVRHVYRFSINIPLNKIFDSSNPTKPVTISFGTKARTLAMSSEVQLSPMNPSSRSTSCTSNPNSCPDGQQCGVGGECRDGDCNSYGGDSTCPSGLHCRYNVCAACTESSHCSGDQKCNYDGTCVDAECIRDEDCPDDGSCMSGIFRNYCAPKKCTIGDKCDGGYCDHTQTCRNVTCYIDENCPEGTYCKEGIFDNSCVPGCRTFDNSGCEGEEFCDDKTNTCKTGCKADFDCPHCTTCNSKTNTCEPIKDWWGYPVECPKGCDTPGATGGSCSKIPGSQCCKDNICRVKCDGPDPSPSPSSSPNPSASPLASSSPQVSSSPRTSPSAVPSQVADLCPDPNDVPIVYTSPPPTYEDRIQSCGSDDRYVSCTKAWEGDCLRRDVCNRCIAVGNWRPVMEDSGTGDGDPPVQVGSCVVHPYCGSCTVDLLVEGACYPGVDECAFQVSTYCGNCC